MVILALANCLVEGSCQTRFNAYEENYPSWTKCYSMCKIAVNVLDAVALASEGFVTLCMKSFIYELPYFTVSISQDFCEVSDHIPGKS